MLVILMEKVMIEAGLVSPYNFQSFMVQTAMEKSLLLEMMSMLVELVSEYWLEQCSSMLWITGHMNAGQWAMSVTVLLLSIW